MFLSCDQSAIIVWRANSSWDPQWATKNRRNSIELEFNNMYTVNNIWYRDTVNILFGVRDMI